MAVTTHSVPTSINNPTAKRLVYNMYRDMLGSYNDKANDIVDALPRQIVREDQGITKQLESMIRQHSTTPNPGEYGSPVETPQYASVPPPPPPPGPGNIPSKRLSTEIPERRLEPPACVQNAMMTKDKKPFTYTPGGLDLSQIKSPRMARRISRNAHAEGVTEVPKQSPLAQQVPGQLPPSALAAMQPALPTPVFPPGGIPPPPPPPPPVNSSANPPPPPPPPMNNFQSEIPSQNSTTQPTSLMNKSPTPMQNYQRPDMKSIIPPNPTALLRQTGGPFRRETFVSEQEPIKPEPQNQIPKQTSPEQVSRPQLGTLYIPPVKSQENQEEFNRTLPRNLQTPTKVIQSPAVIQSPVLNKAPTPWLTQKTPPQPSTPAWAQRNDPNQRSPPLAQTSSPQQSPPWIKDESSQKSSPTIRSPIQPSTPTTWTPPRSEPPTTPGPKIIPVQIERYIESEPQRTQNNTTGIQFQHGRPQVIQTIVVNPVQPPSNQNKARIIPIQIEGSNQTQRPAQSSPSFNESQRRMQHANGTAHIANQDMNAQFRKMQLQEEDQNLMNKFRNQVDEDTFLHNETDPRYRGAAIPSRAFRMLQAMTDTAPNYSTAQRVSPVVVRTIPIQREYDEDKNNHQQQYIPPSEQQVQPEPRKYTGSAIPSRTFRMLQAMTAPNNTTCANTQSTENPENLENFANDPYFTQWGGYDPNYPPHPYWNPYWNYYDPHCYTPNPQQTNESQENMSEDPDMNAQNNSYNSYYPYWDPYGYYYNYYNYPYPPVYSPYPFYQQNSDTDTEGAGYSSCDEMAYYGALFARNASKNYQPSRATTSASTRISPISESIDEKTLEIDKENKTEPTEKCSNGDDSSTSCSCTDSSDSDTDTETDTETDEKRKMTSKSGTLLAIKSVSDINVYEDAQHYLDSVEKAAEDDDDSNDESTEENDEMYSLYDEEEPEIPHQLSVIFEENEVSECETSKSKNRQDSENTLVSEEENSVTLGNNDTGSDGENFRAESTVTVKLPLKLQFSRSEKNEPITTITVEPSNEIVETHYTLKSPVSDSFDSTKENVSFTINLPRKSSSGKLNRSDSRNYSKSPGSTDDITYETAESDSEISVSVSLPIKRLSKDEKSNPSNSSDKLKELSESNENNEANSDCDSETEESSEGTSSSDSSSSDSSSENESESESESEIEEEKTENKNVQTIQRSDSEKQRLLKLLVKASKNFSSNEEIIAANVKEKIDTFENQSKQNEDTAKPKYLKSADITDEEDSGVTSDMSRQISDTDSSEVFTELSKMNRYQRAATHSRLFKLLQDECANEEAAENNSEEKTDNSPNKKETLSLPLETNSNIDLDENASDVASPISPTVNNRLVKELVQSLLKRKKGKCFRHLPLEKLYAAATKILQEDLERCDNISSSEDGGSSSFLSPLPTETVNSSPVLTPQEFLNGSYDDYSAYYNTWARGITENEEYDILPSKTFKLLQDHSVINKPYFTKILPKCPRVLSGKNLPKELQKVTETRETPSPLLENNPAISTEARAT